LNKLIFKVLIIDTDICIDKMFQNIDINICFSQLYTQLNHDYILLNV